MNVINKDNRPSEPMERVLLARNDQRPYSLDIIQRIFTDFEELHGDRSFRDDPAIVGGFARFNGRPVAIVAHQKGRDVVERQKRSFGMPKPDGYRKALRIMKLAEKFNRPIFTLIDTPGAYPGIDAEERGQAEAIAVNLREMARLKVPIVVTITGEGGSGGRWRLASAMSLIFWRTVSIRSSPPKGARRSYGRMPGWRRRPPSA